MGGSNSKPDLKTVFDELDTDKSGTLDKSEITKAMKQIGKSDEEISKTIEELPKNAINFSEFKTIMEGGKIAISPQVKAAAAPAAPAAPAAQAAPAAPPEIVSKEGDKGKGGKSKKGKEGKGKEKGEGKGKEKSKEKGEGKGKGKSKGAPFEPASGPYGSGSGFRLNVKNLAEEIDDGKLKEMFTPHGNVTAAQVKKHESGKSKGFGFVVFAAAEQGEKACTEMNGKEFFGKAIAVAPAERREPGGEGKGSGKDGGGKGKGKMDQMTAAQQQAMMQAAYMQQYQQWMYMQQYNQFLQQQQQGGVPPSPSNQKTEYEGSLKSISKKNGYGFIVCAATHAIYQRDVYVDREQMPENVAVGDRLKFKVDLNPKGHPKVASCKAAI